MDIEEEFLLLLTATIDVKGMPKAYPTVPEQRQEDYYKALKYYITQQPRVKKILFVENSGWPLQKVKEATDENPYTKEVEFISLNANDFPREFGKGYGESALIEYGILNSSLVKKVRYIGKITGRIYLLNMTEILEKVRDDYDCLCDFKQPLFKQIMGDKTAIAYADTRFIVFKKGFYTRYLQPMHNRHEKGCFYSEHQYRRTIELASATARVLPRFPVEPRFSGIAGHFRGKDYGSAPEKIKYTIRGLSRRLIPWLYL